MSSIGIPDSNAIGEFEIGVSPIGTISDLNWPDTVISQYANSPILLTMINNFFQCVDQTENFDNFYDDIWNVATAQGYGLDIWGRIVGVSRVLALSATDYLGMEDNSGQASGNSFNSAPFYSGETLTTNFALPDGAFRQLIYAKALANICDGSAKSINQILLTLFGPTIFLGSIAGTTLTVTSVVQGSIVPGQFLTDNTGQLAADTQVISSITGGGGVGTYEVSPSQTVGLEEMTAGNGNAYVQDNGDMSITYVFGFVPTPVQRAIISESGVLPEPTGMAVNFSFP